LVVHPKLFCEILGCIEMG